MPAEAAIRRVSEGDAMGDDVTRFGPFWPVIDFLELRGPAESLYEAGADLRVCSGNRCLQVRQRAMGGRQKARSCHRRIDL